MSSSAETFVVPQSPCRDCKERFLGCHSTCEAYIKYRKDIAVAKKEYNRIRGKI